MRLKLTKGATLHFVHSLRIIFGVTRTVLRTSQRRMLRLSLRTFARRPYGRSLSTEKFVVPDLPYDYADLQPFLSAEIMQLHHAKHHQAYVNGLNTGYAQLEDAQAKKDLSRIIELEKSLRFNGGGHLNHSIFWGNLQPQKEGGGYLEDGDLSATIQQQYGSQENLEKMMSSVAVTLQGSGWAWLGYDQHNKSLRIAPTCNQDPLKATTGLIPLLGIDVWEHAYYPQYKNLRGEYVKNIWKVVNWQDVALRLEKAKQKDD